MNGVTLLLMMILATVLVTAWLLAPRSERVTVITLVLLGVAAAWGKIALFQKAPQWQDINPDSITYELNGRAFAAHWNGHAVGHAEYRLRGLAAQHATGQHGPEWKADDPFTYGLVVGSHEWLYPAYVGLFYWLGTSSVHVVIGSNALWAAFFPAAAFGIALALGAGRRVALLAAGLALLDPNAGVNASWLLKDTLAGFLAMAVAWALTAHLAGQPGAAGPRLAIAALALGLLGGVRFVAFMGLFLATAAVVVTLWRRRQTRHGTLVLAVLLTAWVLQGVLALAPHLLPADPDLPGATEKPGVARWAMLFGTPVKTVKGSLDTLRASDGEAVADATTQRWKHALSENAALAALKSVAHTLFAPYPWVAIHPGLTWRSASELYYPGTVLWILCLPGIFIAIAKKLRSADSAFWLLLLFLASQLAAYTIWQGEWSTRQRVFALPAFFALAAIGWVHLVALLKRRRIKEATS